MATACVLLKASGEVQDVEVDLAVGSGGVHAQIGGTPQFFHYPEDDLIFNAAREQDESLPFTQHQLLEPYEEENIRGDMLIVKLVGGVRPEGFTVADYEEWQENYEYEPDSDEDDEEESDEEGLTPLQALLLEKVISGFREKHGREPTDEELENLIDVMNEQAEAEEDPEQDEQVMEALEGHVRTTFESSQGRAPTDEEIEAIMAALTGQVTLPEEQEEKPPIAAVEAVDYAEEEV